MAAEADEPELPLVFSDIPLIDLACLSQEEIDSAARTSVQFMLDDIVIPKINFSLFQESSASRKQTYSKLRFSQKREGLDTPFGYRAGHFPVSRWRTAADESGKQEAQRILELIQQHLNQGDHSAPDTAGNCASPPNGVVKVESLCPAENVVTMTNEDASQLARNELPTQTQTQTEDVRLTNVEGAKLTQIEDAGLAQTEDGKLVSCLPDHGNITPTATTTATATSTDKSKRKIRTKEGARRKAFMNSADAFVDHMSSKPTDSATTFLVSPEMNAECNEIRISKEKTEKTVNNSGVSHSPFSKESVTPQLKRKFSTESELQEFFNSIGGEWASNMKKRKIVDAGDYVQGLPQGWKILLGVRKKYGRFIIECRKYISPDSLQFASYKEASAYLSNNGPASSKGAMEDKFCHSYPSHPHESANASEAMDATSKNPGNTPYVLHQNTPNSSGSVTLETGKHKRDTALDRADASLGTKRRYNPNSLNTPMFCKKCSITYSNRSTFMAHLTIHHVKRKKIVDEASNANNENNAVVEVKVPNSTDNETVEAHKESNTNASIIHIKTQKNAQECAALTSAAIHNVLNVKNEVMQQESSSAIDNGKTIADMERNEINLSNGHAANLENAVVVEKEKYECHICYKTFDDKNRYTGHLGVHYRKNLKKQVPGQLTSRKNTNLDDKNNNVYNSDAATGIGAEEQTIASNPFLDLLQETAGEDALTTSNLGGFIGRLDSESAKVQLSFDAANEKFERVAEIDRIQMYMSPKFSFETGEDGNSSACPTSGIRLGGSDMQQASLSTEQFGWDSFLPERESGSSQFIVCIWCNTEFSNDGIEQEQAADSVGFICPLCKSKIAGHVETDNERDRT